MGFYLPCIACTTASWLQFWMAQTAVGDRACLGITTVLTEIFLLEFSNQGMPKVSYMKAAELFLVVSFSFIFLALVESAIVYKATFWSALKEKKNKRVKKVEEPGETQKVSNLFCYIYRDRKREDPGNEVDIKRILCDKRSKQNYTFIFHMWRKRYVQWASRIAFFTCEKYRLLYREN